MSATRCSRRRRCASRSTRRRPRKAYWYRELFEREFPGEACARTVPGGKSIACSSPAAIAWDPAFAAAADPSGRAVAGVHEAALP
jgi:asparagine synthase (glutamine-hydrolysing)